VLVDRRACDERAVVAPTPAAVRAEGLVDCAFDNVCAVYFYPGDAVLGVGVRERAGARFTNPIERRKSPEQ
jgi:hypothetical protein